MLAAVPAFHLKKSMLLPLSDQNWPAILSVFSELEPEVETYLGAGARGQKALSLRHTLDMRYVGQEHSVSVLVDLASTTEAVAVRFHKAHALHFSFSILDNAIEVTGLCIEAVADVPLIGFAAASALPPAAGTAQRKTTRCPCHEAIAFG